MACPVCGSDDNYEINLTTRKHHCWSCNYGGVYTGNLPSPPPGAPVEAKKAGPLVSEFPSYALNAIAKRGFNPERVIQKYDIMWDGSRLCWPTGTGYARRAVYGWEEPKVLTSGEKGFIGAHLLRRGQDIVLTEGDFKAAAIPEPWVGLGIQGHEQLTEFQISYLLLHAPNTVLVLMDTGFEKYSEDIVRALKSKGVTAQLATLAPFGPGPDDVPRNVLIPALLYPHTLETFGLISPEKRD